MIIAAESDLSVEQFQPDPYFVFRLRFGDMLIA